MSWSHEWTMTRGVSRVFECQVCGVKISAGYGDWKPKDQYIPESGPYKGLICQEIAVKRVMTS